MERGKNPSVNITFVVIYTTYSIHSGRLLHAFHPLHHSNRDISISDSLRNLAPVFGSSYCTLVEPDSSGAVLGNQLAILNKPNHAKMITYPAPTPQFAPTFSLEFNP